MILSLFLLNDRLKQLTDAMGLLKASYITPAQHILALIAREL